MKVCDVMTTEVETVQMNSTLEEVASIMKVENVGAVPVVDEDDDLVGIITDRDIVLRCVADGKNPAETTVEEVLSPELQTIEPDVDVEEAARLMADRQIRRLPVCEDGELVGMLSIGDLAVKMPKMDASAEALRDISQGVRGEGSAMRSSRSNRANGNAGAQEGGSQASYAVVANFNYGEELDLEFSGENDMSLSEIHERHSNRHHQASQEAKGAGNTSKKLHPISEGRPRQDLGGIDKDKKKPGQGLSSQQAGEDLKRNNRVVEIRDEAQVGRGRRARKTG